WRAKLMNTSLFRLASLLVTVGAVSTLQDQEMFRNLVYCFAYGHYLLAVFYSKRQIQSAASQPDSLFSTALLLGAGVLLFIFTEGFLPILFTIHVALEEAYLNSKDPRFPSGALSALLICLYLFLFRDTEYARIVHPRLWLAAAVSAWIFFGVCLYRVHRLLSPKELLSRTGPALIVGSAAVISFFYHVSFIQIALYHFLFWLFYPSAKMPGLRFPALMTAVAGTAFLFSPMGFFPAPMDTSLFRKGFLLLSYLHISYSFILSDAQPAWIARLLRPSFKAQGKISRSAAVS
ncbi:MAG TPA: hypothetical protein VD883_02120, partial [Candidatus Omnitrophota bacterium]|nr:hypothetical protein [Candidatus Omnitrophota bacterium]